MAKELKVGIKVDTKRSVKEIDKLSNKLTALEKKLKKTANLNTNLTYKINNATSSTNKLSQAAGKVNNNFKKTNSTVSALSRNISRLASTYLGVMGAKAVLNTSDTITSAENKFNSINGNDDVATQKSMDKMYASAQKVRMLYTDMMGNVSKSIILAGDAFDNNVDNAIRFQEIMSEAYAVGGASAAEMSSSMYQMIQALGSGILQGDELRSVREGAPIAYKEIEKFAQGVYDTDESLKELASQGYITSEIVVAAIMNAGERIDSQFNKTEMTFAQAFTKMKNIAIKSFEPVLQSLNDALNYLNETGAFERLTVAFQIIAGAIMIVIDALLWLRGVVQSVFDFMAQHTKLTATILTVIASVILIAIIPAMMRWLYATMQNIICAVYLFGVWLADILTTNLALTAIIAVLALIVIVLIWVSDSFVDACGIMVGSLVAFGAIVWNIVVGLVNGVIQFLWTAFVEPWIGIIEWVLNVFNGGFNSFGDGVKNLLGNIISWFLSLGKVVTKIIDAIFGTNWTAGLNSLQDSVLEWGKNEEAITLDRKAPEVLQRVAVSDAYSAGYDLGVQGGQWVTDKLGAAKDWLTNKLGMNNSLPSISDPAYNVAGNVNPDDLVGKVGDIADNTGDIKDSMDLTKEDLDYLRRIADMEWKKEFTTANITVDMSNYNTINNETDLDGIVTRLSEKLYEEMNAVADGVYA